MPSIVNKYIRQRITLDAGQKTTNEELIHRLATPFAMHTELPWHPQRQRPRVTSQAFQ
jgi:hypothetical protein